MRSFGIAAAVRIAAVAALLCLGGAASAQSSPLPATTPKVFATVDQVMMESSRLTITGILQGEAAPSAWYLNAMSTSDTAATAQNLEMCQRLALLAMAKPGQYLLEIMTGGSFTHRCKLTRAIP